MNRQQDPTSLSSRDLKAALDEVYDPQDPDDQATEPSTPTDRAQFASAVVVGVCILGALCTCAWRAWS